ncbi:MAG: tRNA pseudouridine(55) synthase TruB [Dehalococcoidia bacterium]|jgi:tRNA pseudouridine55 synthase
MDGILNINKPWGKTSFSIVSLVRRLSGERRVGHAGTLDPAATGVLPVCLGQGTRVVEYLVASPKAYRAEIELGVATDTHDATGTIVSRGDPSKVTKKKLLSALESFRGLIEQTPPMYSAVKHEGKPLYELARSGIQVPRKSRKRWVYRLELLDWHSPVATIEVECGKGTYIRSLADDLGQLLGCGASLKSLTRLRCGIFTIEEAITIARLEEGFRHGYWQQFLYPIDSVLSGWGAVVVDDAAAEAIKNGRPTALEGAELPASVAGNRCRVYSRDGVFLAVLGYDEEKEQWRPEKVFADDR